MFRTLKALQTLHIHPKTHFSVESSDQKYLRQMCAILKTKFFQCNEDIQYQGEIRLVDDKQRLLGFYDILDARKKSQDLEMDLVLINDKSRPAICKMMNYKDSLFKQFAREILQTDMQETGKAQKGKIKSLQLKPSILMGDILVKANMAREFAKKNSSLKVEIRAREDNLEKAKNILYTMRDQIKDTWTAENDNLEIQNYVQENNDSEDSEDEQEETPDLSQPKKRSPSKTLSLSFYKAGEELSLKAKTYNEVQIKTIIDSLVKQMDNSLGKSKVFDISQADLSAKRLQELTYMSSINSSTEEEQQELIDLQNGITKVNGLDDRILLKAQKHIEQTGVNWMPDTDNDDQTLNNWYARISNQRTVLNRYEDILNHHKTHHK